MKYLFRFWKVLFSPASLLVAGMLFLLILLASLRASSQQTVGEEAIAFFIMWLGIVLAILIFSDQDQNPPTD